MTLGFSNKQLEGLLLKSKKRVLSIGIVILTLIIILIIFNAQSKKIELLRADKEAEVKKNDVFGAVSGYEKRIKSYRSFFARIDEYELTNLLTVMAKESNVKLISVKASGEEKLPLYIKYPFDVAISAQSYHSIGKFISRIENQPEAYFVNAITIKSQEEAPVSDKRQIQAPGPKNKLIVNLILSVIAFN